MTWNIRDRNELNSRFFQDIIQKKRIVNNFNAYCITVFLIFIILFSENLFKIGSDTEILDRLYPETTILITRRLQKRQQNEDNNIYEIIHDKKFNNLLAR